MKKYTQKEFDALPTPLNQHDFSGCDLSGLDLSGADLSEANLYEADLSEAYLYAVKGILTMSAHRYRVIAGTTHTGIGCEWHSNDEWRNFSDEEISKMALDALDWWKKHKPIVLAMMDVLESETTQCV